MRVRPATLVVVVTLGGLVSLGALLYLLNELHLLIGRAMLVSFISALLLFAVFVCLPTAVIARAARNKRHGVFSHLKQATTEQVKGERNAA